MRTDPPSLPPAVLRAGPAGYAALFSGEDAPEPSARPRPGGLARALAALFVDSVRTLAGAARSSQAFARSAT